MSNADPGISGGGESRCFWSPRARNPGNGVSPLTENKEHARRRFGFFLFVSGAAAFLVLSLLSLFHNPTSMMDFRTAYCSARCLLKNSDPYNQADVMRIYHAEGDERLTDTDTDRFVVTRNVYLPTEFIVTTPFALLPFYLAEALWVALTIGSFILASYLIWSVGANVAPELNGALICFLLVNAEQVVFYGNPAGLVIGLCAIAAWSLIQERFVSAGILCLAASLALKPHDTVFIWLYFLLAGGAHRRRALQTLAVIAALGAPVVLWVIHISPHWYKEMYANMLAFSVHGGINDPGPAAFVHHGTGVITDLQSVFSVFRDDPLFYNSATYLVCAPMIVAWVLAALRAKRTSAVAWLALAAIVPISMLPLYHRIYDAKLVMLVLPACTLLHHRNGRIGRVALWITTVGFILTGDLPWSTFVSGLIQLRILTPAQPGPLVSAALAFPLPLALLVMGVFYLWVYVRHTLEPLERAAGSAESL